MLLCLERKRCWPSLVRSEVGLVPVNQEMCDDEALYWSPVSGYLLHCYLISSGLYSWPWLVLALAWPARLHPGIQMCLS